AIVWGGACQKPQTMSSATKPAAEPVPVEVESVIAEGALEEVYFKRGEQAALTLRIGGGDYSFPLQPVDGANLEGARSEFGPVAGIYGRMTCTNVDCTSAEIQLRREDRVATIRTESVSLQGEIGQVRD